MQTFLFLLELAGTVAFAVSGAVLGIEKHMDIFGVGLLGITTAVGGGILRDLVVGLTPPRAFQDPMYLLVALGVSVVLFFPFVRRLIGRSKRVFDALMLLMDATGLGIFTITGINTASRCPARRCTAASDPEKSRSAGRNHPRAGRLWRRS